MQITPTARFIPAALVAAFLVLGGSVLAPAAESSLAAAQTRLRYAQEGLDKARGEVKSQEKRVKDAEDDLTRQQQKVDEQKAKLERARNDLAEAKVRSEEAQKAHDDASAEIRRFYEERQQGSTPAAKSN
jgi:chromosome segregation ATPase